MRLAIYNQELSDHVKTATRGDSPSRARSTLARKFADMPPPESPRGKVLGALNPNSLRKYSSSAAKGSTSKRSSRRHGKTPLSKTKKKPAMTPRSSSRDASVTVGDSPTSLLESKSSCDGISKTLPFHIAVDMPLDEESPSVSNSSAPSSTTSSSLMAISTTPRGSRNHDSVKSSGARGLESSPLAKKTSSSLATIPKLKTPSPTSTSKSYELDNAKPILGGRGSHLSRYSSPTDSFLSPISSAMVPKGGKRANARKAMAERSISATSLRPKSASNDRESLNLIKPIKETQAKYLKPSSSTPVLPSLSAKAIVESRLKAKFRSPTDAMLSPVSSHFVKRAGNGRTLEKLNVRKAIFLKQNRK
eukprot:g4866.t1